MASVSSAEASASVEAIGEVKKSGVRSLSRREIEGVMWWLVVGFGVGTGLA